MARKSACIAAIPPGRTVRTAKRAENLGTAGFLAPPPLQPDKAACQVEISALLGTDRPFYGLQARGCEPGDPFYGSIEEMATEYVRSIRAVQPHGPYVLGGWSFGGTVAFEMARQLEAAGEAVPHLLMVDAVENLFDSAADGSPSPSAQAAVVLVGPGSDPWSSPATRPAAGHVANRPSRDVEIVIVSSWRTMPVGRPASDADPISASKSSARVMRPGRNKD